MTDSASQTPSAILFVVDDSPASMSLLHQALVLLPSSSSTTLLLVSDESPLGDHTSVPATRGPGDQPCKVVCPENREEVAPVIVQCAKDLGSRLIALALPEPGDNSLMSQEGYSASLGAEVALLAPIPVLTLHTHDVAREKRERIQRIVIPFDGSKTSRCAFPVAIRFARHLGIPIKLVMVIDPVHALPPAYAYLSPIDLDRHVALTSLRFEANHALGTAENTMRYHGIPVDSDLRFGSIFQCLVDAFQPGDLVVMATDGKGKGTHFGNIAHRLVEESPVPVISIHVPLSGLTDETCHAHWDLAASSPDPVPAGVVKTLVSRINPARASPGVLTTRSTRQHELQPHESR